MVRYILAGSSGWGQVGSGNVMDMALGGGGEEGWVEVRSSVRERFYCIFTR